MAKEKKITDANILLAAKIQLFKKTKIKFYNTNLNFTKKSKIKFYKTNLLLQKKKKKIKFYKKNHLAELAVLRYGSITLAICKTGNCGRNTVLKVGIQGQDSPRLNLYYLSL